MGQPTLPLVILFTVYLIDEFDTAAFAVLAPEIKRTFSLSDQEFFGIVAANLLVLLGLAIPLGFYGDRLPRKKLVIAGMAIAGAFSFLTGLAPSVGLFVLFRIANGVGLVVNDPIHTSLLSDYYPVAARPRVFAFHRNAQRYGAILGAALAGILASLVGWRAVFMVLLLPMVGVAVLATRLPPVHRGASDDPDAAEAAARQAPLSFKQAVRLLSSVRTLRWLYAAWVPIGAALLPLAAYIPIYFDREFGLDSWAIGMIAAAGSATALVGIALSGRWSQRWLAVSPAEPLKWAAVSLAGVGPFLLLLAVAPNVPVALVAVLGAQFVGGMFTPPFVTVQSMVSPARARSLSFSAGALFLALGLVVFSIFFADIGEDDVRRGMVMLTPLWLVGGLVLYGGRRFVAADHQRALDVLASTVQRRAERVQAEADGRVIAELHDVSFSYGALQVLFGVSLRVREGEVLALLGTNGAGKSTVLRVLTGLAAPQSGEVWFRGEEITGRPAEWLAERGLVQVPGGKAVFPDLSVRDNLLVGAHLLRSRPKVVSERMDEVLDLFPRLQQRLSQPAGSLSGGEQQQLALGKALLLRPSLLCIDELSLGLAPVIVEELLDTVRRVRDRGTTLVIVEQSLNIAASLCDRAVFLEKGAVRFEGHPGELLARDDIARAVFLGADAVEASSHPQGVS